MKRKFLPHHRFASISVSFRSALLALAFATLVANVFAGTATYTGTTTGGPTWNRPLAGTPPTPPVSGVGTAVRYSTQAFTVTLNGSYSFLDTATSPALWDNYSFLYLTSFNPASPFTNVLIGNDDNPSIGLTGFTINLTAGVSYIFVTTGFANTDFGAFSNTITGPGNILLAGAAVPEAGPGIVLFGALAGGMMLARARRNAAKV